MLSYTQEKNENYLLYHQSIIKAEEFFFKYKNIDSSLYYYDKTYKDYESFIFLKDLIITAQIAKFCKKNYAKYIEMGFKYGLKPSHLNSIKLLENYKVDLKKYKTNRLVYLKRIDTIYLDYIYEIALSDQIKKHTKDQKVYGDYLDKEILKLKKYILKNGFPSEKKLGINDSTIFKELKRPFLDITKKSRLSKKTVTYNEINESNLTFSILMPFFAHHECMFYIFNDIILKEIKNGNLHPRDFAIINDDYLKSGKNGRCSLCYGLKHEGFIISNRDNSKKFDIKKSNELRKKYFISSYELDEIKRDYEVTHNFKIFTNWHYYSFL